jgi:hypothetical protein
MTTSGTADWVPDLAEIIEEAFERCGQELRSGYDYRTARRSLNLLILEWANRGINLWTVDNATVNLIAGTATYTLPEDTVDLIEHVIRQYPGQQNQTDLTINRISVSTYSTIPNKLVQGRPIQIYINRKTENPTFTVWPVPPTSGTYQLVYWRLRRIEDTGTPAANTMDIPFRFTPALIAGLAYYLSVKIAPDPTRVAYLQSEYERAFDLATQEDRDRAPVRFVPRIAF